ncbi:hypothetical protein EVAR_90233_1 [Eumeta japonica]|uniref:Uncharacterized protein n=1 Tax=Eumeta variegata TaxID=151549 RepID=A0A4C1YT43_EUMVA|nr:hypothetical protein EVAR_90233_1 [Eumeta japonica]
MRRAAGCSADRWRRARASPRARTYVTRATPPAQPPTNIRGAAGARAVAAGRRSLARVEEYNNGSPPPPPPPAAAPHLPRQKSVSAATLPRASTTPRSDYHLVADLV